MSNLTKRGAVYSFDSRVGGRRLRCSLGTSDSKAAARLKTRVEYAIADGPRSSVWPELKHSLPASSYRVLTEGLGVTAPLSCSDFERAYWQHLDARLKLGEITEKTHDLYAWGAKNFFSWLARQKTAAFADVSAQMVDTYVAWRQADLQSRGRTGGMVTEGTVLASIFSLAMEEGLLKSNPLRHKPRKPGLGLAGAEPFSPLEMASLTAQATEDRRFPFLVFRWTGMRCSDVAAITWGSWDREAKTLHWLTAKRKKWVTIPLTEEMNQALAEEHDRVRPEPGDQILAGATKAKLYKFVTLLGRDAGVVRAHPHRFRDSLAVSILAGGGTIYDAAKVLGILVSTAERHYAPFTEQLQGRVRKILESA